jgi:hypothetical protein
MSTNESFPKNNFKDAVQQVGTAIENLRAKNNDNIDVVQQILNDLLNGVISPEDAVSQAKYVQRDLPS